MKLLLRDISTWRGGRSIIAPLDPIVFDREQFDEAVRQLKRDVEAWRPPAKVAPATRPPLITPPPA